MPSANAALGAVLDDTRVIVARLGGDWCRLHRAQRETGAPVPAVAQPRIIP